MGTFSGGIWNIGPTLYHEVSQTDIFTSTQGFAQGVTAEMRVKVVAADISGYQMRIQFDGASSLDLVVKPGSVRYGSNEIGNNANTTEVLVSDNASDFHTYRLAQSPNANLFSLWRDDVLLLDEVTGGIHAGSRWALGSMNGDNVEFYVDYIALTSGAWAPPKIPGDANGDRYVDAADAAIVAGNWQKTIIGGYSVGDFNNDGMVNDLDATIMARHWMMTVDDLDDEEDARDSIFATIDENGNALGLYDE